MTHSQIKPRKRLLALFPHVLSTTCILNKQPVWCRPDILNCNEHVQKRSKATLICQKLACNGEKHVLLRRLFERLRLRSAPFITSTLCCKSKHTLYILQIWLNLCAALFPVNLMYRRGCTGFTSNPRVCVWEFCLNNNKASTSSVNFCKWRGFQRHRKPKGLT